MNKSFNKLFIIAVSIILISSCGGGGGGGGDTPVPPTPPSAPTVNLSANPASVELDNTSTLSWSSTNATTCSAAWTSSNETSGSEDVTISTAGNNTFSITCTGAGGSNSASVEVEGYRSVDGISVDGYISGAEICIDENENWLCDSGENSTTSDNEGEFNIKYANGNLLSIGGTDLDTQVLLDNLLINHKLTGHSEFKVISPITSVASFLSDSSIINPALGIDNSIDIYTFDPVSNKSQSVINDYVYEKGNQLTVLAFTLQNLTNSINTSVETTQDFFKSISEELEQEHSQTNELVDIESSVFIQKVLENVISEKSLSVGDSSKANTVSAISNVLPILKVYSDNQITKAVFNFSISTLQDEIPSIVSGTADETLVNSYTNDIYNYIADDQNIDVTAIRPNTSPRITSNITDLKIDENEFNVATISAVDDDGDQIYFSLSGTDSSLLDISSTGEISFRASPDFEVPSDSDGDNNYEFKVSVTDDASASNSGYDISRSSDDNANVVVQNIDEDLIYFALSSVAGTNTNAPRLIADFTIDSLTFAQEVQLLIENPAGTQQWFYTGVDTNTGINWKIDAELSAFAPEGTYKVRSIRIVRKNNLDDLPITPEIILAKGFSTLTSIKNSRSDNTFPEITTINKIEISQNDGNPDTNVNVLITATVSDASGISEARVFIKAPGGQVRDYTAALNNNNASFEIALDPRAASGVYLIHSFSVTDLAGNTSTYSNDDLISLDLPNRWNLDNSIGDNDKPEITSLSLIGSRDASDFNRKNIKVSVTTNSQASSIERIYIRLKHATDDVQIDEDFPTEQYNLNASAYALEFALPFEYPDGKYTVDYIWIKDKALNESNYEMSAIQSNNWDSSVEFGNRYEFIGKTIDGYVAGAQVFIDENFNFTYDAGELSGITDNEGNLKITLDNETKYTCLLNRPIVANVQAGAIDLSSGVITEPFQMVLPSIKDTGNNKIVISPFTNLLSDAIIQGKVASGIKDEISFSEGCGDVANNVADSISSEIVQLTNSIGQSIGISYNDLLNDFIASSTNTAINEESAQSIAEFFKYFKQASDLFDSELSTIHNKVINTDLAIREDAINTILVNPDVEEIPMNFSAIYRTEPNSAGWFIEEKIDSKGASLNRNGDIIHHTCFNSSENCKTSDLTLDSLRDASERYFRTSSFLNNSYDADGYNYILNTEDSQIVYYNVDGTPKDRTCIYQNWLYLSPKNPRENFTSNDRYNTGISTGTTEDKCKPVEENLTKSLFIALVDSYDDGVIFEELDVRITNPNYLNSTIIKNKVSEIYENRDNLDINPLIIELSTIPRNFKDLNIIRNKLTTNSSDQITIFWTKRNSSGQQTESARINIKYNPDDDEFTYGTFVNSDSGSEYTEITKTKGQQARDDLFATISSKSTIFGTEEFVGSAPVSDNRITISGKTIDGYIEGANVFFDVNFNQRLDAGEYSSVTNANGVFEILVNEADEACVKARPIIADVPVGAQDSTLGEVTKAYQMVLPSVNDAGSNQVVISPFTSLIGEAILKGKNASDLSEDLSVVEGCASAGDAVAQNISTEVSSLINEIESTFNVTWTDLISDFIATGGTSNITEDIAAKVAAFFPYYKEIKDEISSELTSRYNKDVTPNVSLSKDSLEAILSDGEFTELPLEFFSVYQTSPNAQGFYNVDEISSTGATVTANGELKRYLCTLSNSADCDIDGLTLNGVGNASKNYNRQVNINNDNFTVDGVVGNINIRGRDSRGVRNEDSTPEAYCESEETIQFVGPQDSKGLQMEYRYGFNRQLFNAKDCSILPNYGPIMGLRIEKQGRGNNFPNTAPTWAIQFSVNNLGTSRLTNSKIYNIIDNDNLDPAALIKEVAQIPAALSEIDNMRKLLSYGESTLYYYSPNTSVNYDAGEIAEQYYYRASSVPRDDRYEKQECTPDDGCNRVGEEIYGQDARDAIFNVMSGSKYDYDGFVGESAPLSNVLFEYESSGVQFNDRLIDGKNRSYRVYPRLSSSTGWIDASLVGSEISKASIDAFINGDYTINTTFNLGLNVDAPFTSVEEFNLKIFSNDQYSTSSEYLELTVELKIETLASGAVQVTWLDQGKVTFKFVDGDISIIKNIVNSNGDKTRSIPKGSYTFEDFDFLKSLLDKVRDQFGSSELQVIKDFFKNGSDYSFKIDLGAYAILDDYDQISSVIAGIFGIADNPVNSIYSYNNQIIFGEGTEEDICFDTAWAAEEDITFDIKPVYRNKPGFMTPEEVNFSSTSVTIEKGTSQKCVTFSSPVDDKLQEKQEFIEFEIDNVVNAKSGRNIPIRLTVQDN